MTRTDTKGDPINPNRRASASARAPINVDADTHVNSVRATYPASEIIADCMRFFSEHDDGYLKLRRSSTSREVFFVWEWSLGPNAHKYVYVTMEYWRLAEGLDLLRTKVLQVEEGHRRATPDKMKTQ